MSTGAWTALLITILAIILLFAGLAYYIVVYQPSWLGLDVGPTLSQGQFLLQSTRYQSYVTVDNGGNVTMNSDIGSATVFTFTNGEFTVVGNAPSAYTGALLGTNVNKCQVQGIHYIDVIATESGGYNTTWVAAGGQYRPEQCQNSYLWTDGAKVQIRPKLASGSYTWTLVTNSG